MRFFSSTSVPKLILSVGLLTSLLPSASSQTLQPTVYLTGKQLSIEDVVRVARQHYKVSIAKQALNQVKKSHRLLLLAAEHNIPVYGLNRGVGLNKDKTIFRGNVLSAEARKASEHFNLNDIYATSAGVGADAPSDVVRAAMVIRLNTLLLGHAGIQPAGATLLAAFINRDITPILPAGGSVGEADITILAHLGLAMSGQGEVWFKGQKMAASQALRKAGLQPVRLYAKDALSIFSSNAFTAGMATLATFDAKQLLAKYELVFALSLEGINGNIAPFLHAVQTIRPYPNQEMAAKNILQHLEGSYLYKSSSHRALQDPLSFRTASQIIGATQAILIDLENDLLIQLNTSDDNPAVITGIRPDKNASEQEKAFYVSDGKVFGAVMPTANFEPIPWVLNLERLNIALGHLSASSTQRIVKLGSFCINQISRFLSPDKATIAFAAIQKPIMYLNTDIQQQAIPVSTISYPVAGEIEDTATNSLLVVEHLNKILRDLYQIMGFELLHASQAVDLKKIHTRDLLLGKSTNKIHQAFRKRVPFLQKDRPLTPDIKRAVQFVLDYKTEAEK